MPKVLIVFHTLSGNTKAAADAVAEGAKEMPGVDVVVKAGLAAGTDDLLSCDAVALGTPDFFSYMAGGLKDFFDRTYYPTQDRVNDLPCGVFVTHGGGGRAVDSVVQMVKSFKMRMDADPVLVKGAPTESDKGFLRALGRKLAESSLGNAN